MLASDRVWNYTAVEIHGRRRTLAESDFCSVPHYLIALSIPPTWRRGFNCVISLAAFCTYFFNLLLKQKDQDGD